MPFSSQQTTSQSVRQDRTLRIGSGTAGKARWICIGGAPLTDTLDQHAASPRPRVELECRALNGGRREHPPIQELPDCGGHLQNHGPSYSDR